MAGSIRPAAPAAVVRTPKKYSIVPPQHGAWGFLALPFALGIAASGRSSWLVLLGIAWATAYPASWAVTGILTARRPERFRRAALIWSPICMLAGLPLLLARPWLCWVLIGYLLLFGVNLQQTRAGRERSMGNDLVLIAECVMFVPVVAGVVAGAGTFHPPVGRMTGNAVLIAMLACALTLVGSTLHVKSLIRARRNPAFATMSRAFALTAPLVMWAGCVAAGFPTWTAAPFILLAARALWLHDPNSRPGRIGMIELAGLIAVAGTALLAL